MCVTELIVINVGLLSKYLPVVQGVFIDRFHYDR